MASNNQRVEKRESDEIRLNLSAKDAQIFFCHLMNPPDPNENLKIAVQQLETRLAQSQS